MGIHTSDWGQEIPPREGCAVFDALFGGELSSEERKQPWFQDSLGATQS